MAALLSRRRGDYGLYCQRAKKIGVHHCSDVYLFWLVGRVRDHYLGLGVFPARGCWYSTVLAFSTDHLRELSVRLSRDQQAEVRQLQTALFPTPMRFRPPLLLGNITAKPWQCFDHKMPFVPLKVRQLNPSSNRGKHGKEQQD